MDRPESRWATSIGLLRNLQAGDDAGWRQFVHLYTPLVHAWARKAGLQDADAADLCQDVFRAVAAGIDGFDYDRPAASFRGWLWTITRRKLARHYGRTSEQANAAGGTAAMQMLDQIPDWIDNEAAPQTGTAESEVIRRAAELIRGDFEPHTWQAFWLLAVEGRSAADIAAKLGMTDNAVRQAKYRVLARLKEFVGFE